MMRCDIDCFAVYCNIRFHCIFRSPPEVETIGSLHPDGFPFQSSLPSAKPETHHEHRNIMVMCLMMYNIHHEDFILSTGQTLSHYWSANKWTDIILRHDMLTLLERLDEIWSCILSMVSVFAPKAGMRDIFARGVFFILWICWIVLAYAHTYDYAHMIIHTHVPRILCT